MIYLLISILASVSVSVLLKIARQKQIGLAQAIGVNYAVATLLTAALLEPNFANWQQTLLPHAWLFGLLGVLLPSVFVIMGKAVQHAGIVKSDAAQRLSLFCLCWRRLRCLVKRSRRIGRWACCWRLLRWRVC